MPHLQYYYMEYKYARESNKNAAFCLFTRYILLWQHIEWLKLNQIELDAVNGHEMERYYNNNYKNKQQ